MIDPVILVDKQDLEIGTMDRAQAELKPDAIIRMVYLLLVDKEGRLLLQRRKPDLERYPNYWTVSATGAVHPGEGYVKAAERKLMDELGIAIPVSMVRKEILPLPGRASYMTALFVGRVDDPTSIRPDEKRVQEVRWLRLDEALQGYMLTPTCEQTLRWWQKHGQDFLKG